CQADGARCRELVARLLRAAARALVIAGAEPLPAILQSCDPEAEIYPLGEERGVATFLALKAPPDRHPNDFDAAELAALVARHPNPLRLLALRLSAWKTTGFYPRHEPRLWEYPTVADRVSAFLPPGSRIVDIGAGVNPLVPYLTSLGYQVDTVDSSPLRRAWPPQPDWNEWDFLDYSACGLAHGSWNCTLDQLPRSSTFDGAYSVSVVEHLPAADRRALFGEIRDRLQPEGVVILTVDLLRGSDALWNRNRGLEIEAAASHGTIGDLLSELSRVGFDLVEVEYLRDWGQVVVDTCLVVARRT
ncbi:MAG: hypothetical protein QOJ16_5069, partial [Acidobacteriota bacterium]|nr:hypothetical protein [Acidobacteriota bacterium]